VKHVQSSSSEASSSQKKSCQEPRDVIPSRGISRSKAKPKPTRVNSDEDEDSIVQFHPRSHRTQCLAVATIEEAPEGLAEG